VIESCTMAQQAVESSLHSQLDLTCSENIQQRVQELVTDTGILIDAIYQLGSGISTDPLCDPVVLSAAVREGFLDAPQLCNNPYGLGEISTMIDRRGACVVTEKDTGKVIREEDRVSRLLMRKKR
jgi:hypothetical protein